MPNSTDIGRREPESSNPAPAVMVNSIAYFSVSVRVSDHSVDITIDGRDGQDERARQKDLVEARQVEQGIEAGQADDRQRAQRRRAD